RVDGPDAEHVCADSEPGPVGRRACVESRGVECAAEAQLRSTNAGLAGGEPEHDRAAGDDPPAGHCRRRRAMARERLTRERVVEAAIALVDAEGIDALTMRRLGKELGVEGMALYTHVENKDGLLNAVSQQILSELELPDPR